MARSCLFYLTCSPLFRFTYVDMNAINSNGPIFPISPWHPPAWDIGREVGTGQGNSQRKVPGL